MQGGRIGDDDMIVDTVEVEGAAELSARGVPDRPADQRAGVSGGRCVCRGHPGGFVQPPLRQRGGGAGRRGG